SKKMQLTTFFCRIKCSCMHFIRYLQNPVRKDLGPRMVFIGGPRQVGKTTFAKSFLAKRSAYLSWDDLEDRETIKSHQLDYANRLYVFDEIHKYSRWRSLLKGAYDKHGDHLKIIVTGSAR